MRQRWRHRGGERPSDALTLNEATALAGLRGKNAMTIRRALEPVRIGEWLPAGAQHWLVLYEADAVRQIEASLAAGEPNPYRPRPPDRPPRPRPRSKVPAGPPPGWATADQIQQALHEHGVDGTLFAPRWLRTRLRALGVPSQRWLVGRIIQRAFPFSEAIEALRADPLVRNRVRGYRMPHP